MLTVLAIGIVIGFIVGSLCGFPTTIREWRYKRFLVNLIETVRRFGVRDPVTGDRTVTVSKELLDSWVKGAKRC
jgi:hypothetical protein